MATFTYTPDFKAKKRAAPNVSTVKFGDGYEQRFPVGINTNPASWILSFTNRTSDEIDEIEEFLVARGGHESFDWTPPRASESIKVKCTSWDRSIDYGVIDSLTANFEQIFEP